MKLDDIYEWITFYDIVNINFIYWISLEWRVYTSFSCDIQCDCCAFGVKAIMQLFYKYVVLIEEYLFGKTNDLCC